MPSPAALSAFSGFATRTPFYFYPTHLKSLRAPRWLTCIWEVRRAPVLGDEAYGDNTALRERLHAANREYVLAVGAQTTVYAPQTTFKVAARKGTTGRPPTRPRPDQEAVAIKDLIARVGQDAAQTVSFRDGPDGAPVTSQFIFVRVRSEPPTTSRARPRHRARNG